MSALTRRHTERPPIRTSIQQIRENSRITRATSVQTRNEENRQRLLIENEARRQEKERLNQIDIRRIQEEERIAEIERQVIYERDRILKARPPMPEITEQTNMNNFTAIDHINAEDCYLGGPNIGHVEKVPLENRRQWANATSTILGEILKAIDDDDDVQVNRMLKWHLALHHILLRSPNHGVGGRQYTGELNRRFRLFEEKEFNRLINEWIEKGSKKSTVQRVEEKNQEILIEKTTKKAVNLILGGFLSRAVRKMRNLTNAKAVMSKVEVQSQAKDKHPIRMVQNYWSPEDIGVKKELEFKLLRLLNIWTEQKGQEQVDYRMSFYGVCRRWSGNLIRKKGN